jgi:hypothetical protein
MKEYIGRLPVNVRHRARQYPKGYMLPEAIKLKIRWQAMVKAAPPFGGRF